jgi:prophage regulatory protein
MTASKVRWADIKLEEGIPIPPDDKLLLSYEDLATLGIPYSRMQLGRKMKAGTFPQAVRLGGNRIAWWRHEIIAWIESRERVD